MDSTHITGCCDRSLALAVSSVLSAYPRAQVWLWSDAQDWSQALVRSRILDSHRLVFRYFDGKKEAADFPQLAAFFASKATWEHRSVVWSDLVRYVVLRNYGGSYLDADTALLRPVAETLALHDLDPDLEQEALLDLNGFKTPNQSPDFTLPCDRALLTPGMQQHVPEYCIASNGVLLNFPARHWLFEEILNKVNKGDKIAGSFFNDFGPSLLTHVANLGYRQHRGVLPRILNFLAWTGLGAVKGEYQPPYYSNSRNTKFGALHTELDEGDFVDGSLCHFTLCTNVYNLALPVPKTCGVFDKYPQEHWSRNPPLLASITEEQRPESQHRGTVVLKRRSEANRPESVSPSNAEHSSPDSMARENEWGIWHFTWMRDRAQRASRSRGDTSTTSTTPPTQASSQLTGCCDHSLALAIASVLASYPDAQVWLWSDNSEWTQELVRSHILNSPRLHFKFFDPQAEVKSAFPNAEHLVTTLRSALVRGGAGMWSSFARTVIMLNYGGSFLDAGAILLRPVSVTLAEAGKASFAKGTPLVDLCCRAAEARPPPEGLLLPVQQGRSSPKNETCYGDAGGVLALFNFPDHHWLFQDALAQLLASFDDLVRRSLRGIGLGACHTLTMLTQGFVQKRLSVPLLLRSFSVSQTAPEGVRVRHGSRGAVGLGDDNAGSLHLGLQDGVFREGSALHRILCSVSQNVPDLLESHPLCEPVGQTQSTARPQAGARSTRSDKPAEDEAESTFSPPPSGPWALWHLVWTRRTPEDVSSDRNRVLMPSDKPSPDSLTGCCDGALRLSISNILALYPQSQVWIWSDNKDWSSALVRRILINSPRVHFRYLDAKKEAENLEQVAAFLLSDASWAHRAALWTDVARLLVLRNYGGSYLDVDVALLRTLEDTLERLGVEDFEAEAHEIVNLSGSVEWDGYTVVHDKVPCDNVLLPAVIQGTRTLCIMGVQVFLNFPARHWLFTDALAALNMQAGGLSGRHYGDFGNYFLTSILRKGLSAGKLGMPRMIPFLTWTGSGAVRGEYRPPYYENVSRSKAGAMNVDLGDGDVVAGSLTHFITCFQSFRAKVLPLPASCNAYDKYHDEHWITLAELPPKRQRIVTTKAPPTRPVGAFEQMPWTWSWGQYGRWGLWHFVWTRPKSSERSYDPSKERFVDHELLTGCCDRSLSLAIASVLAVYPSSQVWLWSDNKSWTTDFVRTNLINSTRLHFRFFDGAREAAEYPRVAHFFTTNVTWPYRAIVWADIARYVILRNYGGSYLDADTSILRPLSETLQMYGLNPKEDGALIDFCCSSPPPGGDSLPPCLDLLLTREDRNLTGLGCTGSNGVLLNFPPRHWLFEEALSRLEVEERLVGHYFNDFGPYFLSTCIRAGYDRGWPLVPRFFHFLNWVGKKSVREIAHEDDLKNVLTNPKGCLHTELDDGDIIDGSLTHQILCKHRKTLRIQDDEGSASCRRWE